MSRSGVNKTILVGRLGQKPEVKYLQSGVPVVSVSLATSESWKDKQTGEVKEQTEWHRLVFYRKLAEIAGEYLTKGSLIFVEGKLQTRKWQDQSGVDRQITEIIVDELTMLERRSGDQQEQTSRSGDRSDPKISNPFAEKKSALSIDDFEDDIPF